jgi:hypothetical protein
MADNQKKINWGEMLGVGFRNMGGSYFVFVTFIGEGGKD